MTAFGLASCYRADDCNPVTRDYIVLQFVNLSDKAVTDTLTVASYSYGAIYNDTLSSIFDLPLDPSYDTITYTFNKPGYSNWIKVGYSSVVDVPQGDCGPQFVYSQLEILDTSYDSVRLVDKTMLPTVKVNVKVIYE